MQLAQAPTRWTSGTLVSLVSGLLGPSRTLWPTRITKNSWCVRSQYLGESA